MVAWRYEISLLMLKKIFTSERSERVKYFSTLKENFPSPRGHIISSIYTPCFNNGKYVSLLLLVFFNVDHYHQTNVNIFLFERRPQSIKSYYTTMKNT